MTTHGCKSARRCQTSKRYLVHRRFESERSLLSARTLIFGTGSKTSGRRRIASGYASTIIHDVSPVLHPHTSPAQRRAIHATGLNSKRTGVVTPERRRMYGGATNRSNRRDVYRVRCPLPFSEQRRVFPARKKAKPNVMKIGFLRVKSWLAAGVKKR